MKARRIEEFNHINVGLEYSHVPTESAMVGMHVIGRDRYSCQIVSCVECSVIINYRVPEITVTELLYNTVPVTPLLTWFNFNPRMDKDHTPGKVWDKITYPFPNFNGAIFEVWEWTNNFMPHLMMDIIMYPCWN